MAYQLWSKSDNSRLRFGDKAIFKMAAVRHLEFAKIPFWSSDRYLHVILHLHSETCINRPIWHRYIAKKRFSIWRPSAVLNLKNFDFLSNLHARNGNLYLCTKFDRNLIIHGWDMEIKQSYFQNGGRPPSWICENCSFGHVTYIGIWSFISVPNFALIG